MAQFASLSGHDKAFAGVAAEDDVRPEQRMAELALAFDLELAAAEADTDKWPLGSTIAFAVSVSAALWIVIGVIAYFVL